MSDQSAPVAIPLEKVDNLFQRRQATNLTVARTLNSKWIFTFETPNPITGDLEVCTLETQRGKIREWADPRHLFQWLLQRYGVEDGNFKILT